METVESYNPENNESIEAELPNFHQVSPILVRGGQPTQTGLQLLKERGISTVINLREEPFTIEKERQIALSLDLDFISIPLRPFDRPKEECVEKFLELTLEPEPQNSIFVHCLHGMDRTGLMCGLYRMKASDWTYEQTVAEMLELGFHAAFTNLSDVLKTYAKLWGKI